MGDRRVAPSLQEPCGKNELHYPGFHRTSDLCHLYQLSAEHPFLIRALLVEQDARPVWIRRGTDPVPLQKEGETTVTRERSKRKWFYLILILLLLGAGAFYYWGWFGQNGSNQRYRMVKVERGDITSSVTATGTINPVVTVLVGSQVSGTIKALYADFNSRVKEGDIIAQIDPAIFQAQVDQAKASVATAQAGLCECSGQSTECFRPILSRPRWQ